MGFIINARSATEGFQWSSDLGQDIMGDRLQSMYVVISLSERGPRTFVQRRCGVELKQR